MTWNFVPAIPAVLVDVDSADRRPEIDFGFLYTRICRALLAPSVLDGFGIPQDLERPPDPTENSRMMLENAIVGRQLQHLILDEVIHFLNSSTPPIHYGGNLLKSLSNRSNFNLVLIGAYGSEALIHATAQLARRITVIHCPRYKSCEKDFKYYATFIKSVSTCMPYHFEIDLEHDCEYIFEGTFGLPGASAQVILEAAARCSKEKIPRWSKVNLVKSMPSLEEHHQIARETLLGEERIQPYLQGKLVKRYPTEEETRMELEQERQENSRLNRRRGQ